MNILKKDDGMDEWENVEGGCKPPKSVSQTISVFLLCMRRVGWMGVGVVWMGGVVGVVASLTPQRSRSPPHSVLFHEVRTGLRPVEDGSAFIGGELRF
ncbi:hypothetical protein PHYBLDRAFT_183736 [Phycomyces blakesleeanus NRRL 1555(-)]|uniref:Transmembrane protein n=1 Tax=Phycomyces blakesleeanus (strain ATCC 8743b / DSM 1359 / FGSC 10004 / NBRC 33097 / NRRL 1555) TaxID=763407 RepID=A0A162TFZ8_PHYB8|nr:hypothetical protein PHYBLDRAFT_183736 [Phycomyces blakesleeanus NRRL 1555(-)]OAD66833.1 hypothetical protein PHYBLDRAFT_183736 [Phycomyces blakesleeanus NRRL 1555(-)]|eukprot:XP_018284873.1 hypothetical protein PHYBLDRAFT_183736 [Phycomyces blakesleeanus NRRL 1555(-)]